MKSLLILLSTLSLAQTVTPDGMRTRSNLRDARYCEVLLVQGNMLKAKAEVYNTIGLNECPADAWAKLDAKQIKAEFKAASVILNGPRHFIMDGNGIKTAPGNLASFGGIQMRLLAYLEITPMTQKRTPYTDNPVERQTEYTYKAGKKIYQLTAPGGQAYIMQSYSQEADKSLDMAGLDTLARKLKLPPGWKYSVKTLDRELIIRNSGTKAYVLQDDLRNSYQRMN